MMLSLTSQVACADSVIVGSKKFTESYVLGEIAKKLIKDAGVEVEHKQGMGGTIILWQALRTGAITMYPEYTGTIGEEILKSPGLDIEAMRARLAQNGMMMTDELGFNNTYALVMRQDKAKQLGIRRISDLRNHPELVAGMTHEFLSRKDGWTPLTRRYGLNLRDVKGINHTLGYAALKSGEVDVKDAYSTDAEIADYRLTVLEDDLGFFPQYKAVFLYRKETDPRAVTAISKLAGTIDEAQMIRMNAEAKRTKDYAAAASLYFKAGGQETAQTESVAAKIGRLTLQHLWLVGWSLLLAVIVGLPLGILASRPGILSQMILGIAGIFQTIPSLALLALLVPVSFFGISARTAIFALFLYSLLPVIRNTAAGLQEIPRPIRESAIALGLSSREQLIAVYLPMASRTILAGIKTSAVINVGTATLAALIGQGGLGEPIISGLDVNDAPTILQGAIPAAVLAILVQLLFELLDRIIIPRGLRLKAAS